MMLNLLHIEFVLWCYSDEYFIVPYTKASALWLLRPAPTQPCKFVNVYVTTLLMAKIISLFWTYE